MSAKLKTTYGWLYRLKIGFFFQVFDIACFVSKSGGGEVADGWNPLSTEGVFVVAKQAS